MGMRYYSEDKCVSRKYFVIFSQLLLNLSTCAHALRVVCIHVRNQMKREDIVVPFAGLTAVARHVIAWAGGERRWFFYGGMGSGKTTFIRAVCECLSVQDEVTSPTFSLLHEYKNTQETLYHFDCYRLASPQEAYEIGIVECLESQAYCFVEWSERIPTLLPTPRVELHFAILSKHSRSVSLRTP